jgi:hypothetical protein
MYLSVTLCISMVEYYYTKRKDVLRSGVSSHSTNQWTEDPNIRITVKEFIFITKRRHVLQLAIVF